MSYTEKMDVLDLLINVLREHEEKLDTLVTRLEKAAGVIDGTPPEKSEEHDPHEEPFPCFWGDV